MHLTIPPNLTGLSGVLLLAISFQGCSSTIVPDFILGEEPDNMQGVVEVREALLGPGEEGPGEEGPDEAGPGEASHTEHEHAHDDDDHDETEIAGPAGPIDVVVVGQVGGLPNPWEKTEPNFPFVQGEAKFFLADAGEVAEHQAEGHQHAASEECAFCDAHAGDSTAMLAVVQFKDKSGKIFRRDARHLFDLKGSETVVVRGKARIVEGGLLVVDADGLYVRR